jgi:hypothetical protein
MSARRNLNGPLWLLVAALLCGTARADVILTAENLNESLKELQRQQRRMAAAGASVEEQAAALLAIAREADALTQRFSDEVAAHGDQQKGLIDLGLRRLGQLEIGIRRSDGGTFRYDGEHCRRYLKLLPSGPGAEHCTYRLIYIDFFGTDATSREELVAAAERKREFLERFPESAHAAEVGFLLGIDYRDLWRRCREAGDGACSAAYEQRVRQVLRDVVTGWPGSRHAALAQAFLGRFDAEARGKAGAAEP